VFRGSAGTGAPYETPIDVPYFYVVGRAGQAQRLKGVALLVGFFEDQVFVLHLTAVGFEADAAGLGEF
jgi:hypothetical protein